MPGLHQNIHRQYYVCAPCFFLKKKDSTKGETSLDFSLKKVVPDFEPGLVTGFPLTPGLQRSNQYNSGEVGAPCLFLLHYFQEVENSVRARPLS